MRGDPRSMVPVRLAGAEVTEAFWAKLVVLSCLYAWTKTDLRQASKSPIRLILMSAGDKNSGF